MCDVRTALRSGAGLLLAAVVTLLGAPVAGAASFQYSVGMPEPAGHYFEVLLRVEENRESSLTLVMPVWTPGSYLVREYARHVQDFTARAEGRPLPWLKIDKNHWRIEAGAAPTLEIRYRVYANDLSVQAADLDEHHGYFNGAALFMYAEGRQEAPFKLTLNPYPGWKIATSLDPVASEPNTFAAPNFDILIDSPVEMGTFEEIVFRVHGVMHRIVVHGPTVYDRNRMLQDIRGIVEQEVNLFGDVPYPHYTFLLHLGISGGGGLEHLNSTSVQSSAASLRRTEDRESLLETVAHEFFHVWNVKRIRPAALGPFDYTRENYTRGLWISEGITSYYDGLFLVRAGIATPKRYLQKLSEMIQRYRQTPGRLHQSAEEASFDAWIKYYRQNENSVNSQISYYDKGALLGLMLDMKIRRQTENRQSLDSVMRLLNERYSRSASGFEDGDFQSAVATIAGGSWSEFFQQYVSGVVDFPLEDYVAAAGLSLGPKKAPEADDEKEKLDTVNLGIRTARSGERTLISGVLESTPAHRAGLNAGDELLAFDGVRVNEADYRQRLQDYRPGDAVRVQVFRDNRLREIVVTLDPPVPVLDIVLEENASALQKQTYTLWLGAEWEEKKP